MKKHQKPIKIKIKEETHVQVAVHMFQDLGLLEKVACLHWLFVGLHGCHGPVLAFCWPALAADIISKLKEQQKRD
jgi:hypothetical protein